MAAEQIFQGIAGRNDKNSGWTSVYFPIAQDYQSAYTLLNQINTLELTFLCNSVTVPFLRVSEVHTPGDAYYGTITTVQGGVAATDPPGQADSSLSLPFFVAAGLNHRTTKYIRGLPGSSLVGTDPFTWSFLAPVLPLLQAWQDFYKGNFGIWNRPGKRNNGVESLPTITQVLRPKVDQHGNYVGSVRRSGRPFGLHPGRRHVG